MNYSNQTSILIPDSYTLKNNTVMTPSDTSHKENLGIKALVNKVISEVKKESPALYWIVVAHFAFIPVCILGLMFDDRLLMGVNVWIKPLKFLISTGIYIFTFGYFTTLYPFSNRKKKILNNVVAWTLLVETVIIVVQGMRGVQSHYNITSPLDGILFAAMGILVTVNVLIMVLYVVETFRQKMTTSKSIQWSILLGWVILIVGSWVGGQMISQMSHNVGVADGGAGLPLVNWSTIAGDLRIAHFFGIHGMQIIPLFAFYISRKWNTSNRNQIIAVTIFGLLYAGWIGFTFLQAKQGMALLSL